MVQNVVRRSIAQPKEQHSNPVPSEHKNQIFIVDRWTNRALHKQLQNVPLAIKAAGQAIKIRRIIQHSAHSGFPIVENNVEVYLECSEKSIDLSTSTVLILVCL